MKLQSSPSNKPKRIRVSSNMEPDVAQQFIAEIGFSFLDRSSNASSQQKMKKSESVPSFARIAASPFAFGQRIDGCKVVDSFQQVKDRNGVSWWYDTSNDSDCNTEQ